MNRNDDHPSDDKNVEEKTSFDYSECSVFKYRVLDAMVNVLNTKSWQSQSPFLLSIRNHISRSIEFCLRSHRLIVGDPDPVQSSALKVAKYVWGTGVTVFLISLQEYTEAKLNLKNSAFGNYRNLVMPVITMLSPRDPQFCHSPRRCH